MIKINIAREYTDTPGGRYITDGKFSGQDFRNEILEPRFLKAQENDEILFIDLDGGFGYGSSFLEEAFGGLARLYPNSIEFMLKSFQYKSDDEPLLCKRIPAFIEHEKRH